MVIKRASNCPLCGARLTAMELLDSCTELVDSTLGVLEAHCPYCQGYLEVMAVADRADIGYMVGTERKHFDVALSLPCEGLEVERTKDMTHLILKVPGHSWEFSEQTREHS